MVTKIKQFTDIIINSLPSESSTKEKTGLLLDIGKKGKKMWRKRGRIDGKVRSITLGSYPSLSIEEARTVFFAIKDSEGSKEIATVEDLINEFCSRYLKKHRKDVERVERTINKDIIPLFGGFNIHRLL